MWPTGPWVQSRPHLIAGMDGASGCPIVIKMLPTDNEDTIRAQHAELHAVEVLELDKEPPSCLVPCKV